MKSFLKKITKKIYERKFLVILCCIFLVGYIIVFFPRSYSGLSKKTELGEVNEIEISFDYHSRDEHEMVITEKYCNRFLINDKETISNIETMLDSIPMKPKYNYGEFNIEGLAWHIRVAGQNDYDLELLTYSNKDGKYYISVEPLAKENRTRRDEKYYYPQCYKITEEQNEEIIQVLFQALQDNITDMTVERALQLSEKNAEWPEFMYYYAIDQDIFGKNAVRFPIQDTDMELEIYYRIIHERYAYKEPIERAVLYDAEGNEYEYFSDEAREVLKKEVMKN